MAERTSPHDLQAERAVLGACLINNDVLATAIPIVQASDFYRSAHALIYGAILALGHKNQRIDLVTVKDWLLLAGTLDECGGVAYIAGLTDGVPRSANVEYYCEIVARYARARKLIQTCSDGIARAYDREDPDKVIDDIGQAVFMLGQKRARSALVPIGQIAEGVMAEIIDRPQGQAMQSGVMTGFQSLDNLIGGFRDGSLVLVAARPSMGKSAWVTQVVHHVGVKLGLTVALFSLEMTGPELVMRELSCVGRVDGLRIQQGYCSEGDYERMSQAFATMSESKVYVDEGLDLTMFALRAKARALKMQHGLSLIAIDYLQLMEGDEKAENRTIQIAQISRALKGLAKELQVPVVALSQLSRAADVRRDKRPQLSDLRESGALEQDADMVIFIHREEEYGRKDSNAGQADIIVAKNRNGPKGSFKFQWIAPFMRFEETTVL